ncbi:MAG: nucleotide exchange factor GrpE [Victivallaceae bacterium]|nr:nucleotide exchange factor GrpE [Victivallaceae bacterium]
MTKKKKSEAAVESVEETEIGAGTAGKAIAETAAETAPEEQLEVLSAELDKAKDDLLRLKADFQNYRMRTAKEIASARLFGQTDTLLPFLQIFDHFSMAMAAAEKSDNVEAIKEGLEMILKEYQKGLDELNVVPFNAEGEKFDPQLHNAVAHEPSAEVKEGYVIRQWNAGYKLGERLLRPAAVVVSSGPAPDKPGEA